MIIPKTEYVEPNRASRPCPATYQGVIDTIKELESKSNEKVSELESKLQAVTAENEIIKASLSAKERECALYQEKYQTVSAELEEIKAVFKAREEAEIKKRAENRIVPVINLDCTNSDYTSSESPSDQSQETLLFTDPALSLEPQSQQETTNRATTTTNTSDNPEPEVQDPRSNPETRDESKPSDQFIEEIIQDGLNNQQQPTTSRSNNPTSSDEIVREETISTDALPETPKITAPGNKNKKRSLLEVMEALERDEQPPKRTKTLPQHTPMDYVCGFLPCDWIRFATIEQYRRHVMNVHPERRFHCSKCPFTTNYQHSLNLHEKCHDKHAQFVGECTLCNVSLSKTHWRRHFTWYHGE